MKKTMLLLTVGLAILANPTYSDIYKWTDANGDVHFSDKPHDGAEAIKLPPVQTYSPPPVDVVDDAKEVVGRPPEVGYDTLEIAQPQDQATVRDNRGNMSVLIKLSPKLKRTDALQLLVDDNPVGVPQQTPLFTLMNVLRGSHTLQVKVINKEGKVLQKSKSITFFMQRNRLNQIGR